ncbi:hypothetical protein L218DRAFT_883016 [Marasmius fiardii PR-910]|nr:hypothetical protein L218DRAFT_883016 [Marasmius fiardii PR-910]
MDSVCSYCHALHWIDEHLANTSVQTPVFGSCCLSSNICLSPLTPPPPSFWQLLQSNTIFGHNYCYNIWKYNRAFPFTSLGVDHEDYSNNNSMSIPVFCISGELHYCIGCLLPPPGRMPTYSQIYLYDPENALLILD